MLSGYTPFPENNLYITNKGEHQNHQTMKTGTVKFYNSLRGFGFIKVDETNEELFVHKSEIQGTIQENDTVEFEIQKGKKGLNAVNVRVI
jgi:cold shock protein